MTSPTRSLLLGLVSMALGMVFIPIGDSIAKYISQITPYSAAFLAWSRFAIGVLLVLPIALYTKTLYNRSRYFFFQQAVRAALIAATISLIIQAVSLTPVAEAFGAFFVGPALSVVFSVWFLKEKVTRLEWLSVVLGFVGVLMVLQPSANMSPGLLWALAAGVFYAGFLVATRWAAHSGPPLAQLATQLVFGCAFLLPIAASDLVSYGVQTPDLLLIMGITSALANLFSIVALARASASFLAPVVYLQVVAATLIGIYFFKDTINPLAATGLIVIVITGLLKIPRASTPA